MGQTHVLMEWCCFKKLHATIALWRDGISKAVFIMMPMVMFDGDIDGDYGGA